ncbi:MAG: response regulator transcription factor [Tomitella sp.]|nr:response regulator transcription factor [Tomitella sp.]
MIRLLIVDDDPMVRSGLGAILGAETDMTVVGEADDGAPVPGLVRSLAPDLVVMDVRMPVVDGIDATRAVLRAAQNPPAVLVITTFENDSYVYEAMRAGAGGFLLKRASAATLVHAVRVVAAGEGILFPAPVREFHVGQRAAKKSPDGAQRAGLTGREAEVLRAMARGLNNAEIADLLFLGVETVKTHVGAVLGKLGARDRTQAVIAAYESGFITPGGTAR